jgi:hypothetical protein
MKELQKRETAETILKSLFPVRRMGTITTGVHNGYPYARSMIKTSAPHISQAIIDATLFLDGPRAYIVMLYCQRHEIGKYQAQFDRIRQSFRPYDVARDGDVPKIRSYLWKKGDSWEKLANRGGRILGRFTAEKLAVLNGMDVTDSPAAGTIIKNIQ